MGVGSLVVSGRGVHAREVKGMGEGFYEDGRVEGVGHYIVEEKLEGFVREVLEFVGGGD